MRPGELVALQLKDIDFKRKLVIINKALESGSTTINKGKNKVKFPGDARKAYGGKRVTGVPRGLQNRCVGLIPHR